MGRPCFREGVVARRKRGGMRRTSNNKSINKYKQLKRIKIKKDFKDTDILGSRSETAVKKIKVLSETYDPSTSKIFDYEFDDDYFADSGENMGVEDEVSTKSATKTTVGKKSKKKKVKVEEPTDDENTESGQLFSNIDSLPSEGSEVTKSRNDFGGNVRDDFKDLVPGLGSRKASAIDFSGDATVDFYENIMKNLQDFSGSVVDDFAEQIKQDEALSLTRADFNGDVAVDFGRLAVYSFSKKVEVPMADFSGNVSEDFRELIHYCDDEVTFSLTDGGFGPCGIGKFSAVVERDFKDLLRLYKNFRAAKMCSQDADTKEGKSFECRQDSGILACSRELSGCKRRTVHESFDHGTGKDFRVSFSKPHKLNSSELYSVFSAAKFASEAGLKVPGVDTEGFVDDKFVEFLQEENKHTDVRHVINECAMNRPEFKDTETFHNYLELYKSYYQSQTLYNFDLEEKDDNAFALVEQQFKQYLRLVNMFTVAKMYSESGRHVPGIDSNGFVDERFVDYLNKIFNVNVRKVINDSAMLTAGPEIRGEETNYYKEYLYFYSKAIPDPDIGLTCQDYGSSSHLANTPSCVGGCQEKGSCCRFPDALNKAKSCEAPSCNIVMSHPVARDCTTSIRELSCGRQYESACNATRKSCGRWDQCVHTCRTGCFQDENDKKCSDDIKYIYVEPRKRRSVELDDTPDVDDALVVWADVGSGVEQTRNHHSGESAARYVKEPRLSQHSTQLRMGRKDGGKTKKSRKLSFTDEIFKNASVESLEEKINDENGRATEKDSAMYCVVKNGDTKSGRHQNGGNIPKLRKLRFLRDLDDDLGDDDMFNNSRSHRSAGSQKRHARLSRSASERTDKASKGFATGSRHVDESVEDSTLSMSKDSESSSEEEPARKSRPSKRTARAASDRALRRRSGSSSPSRGADESEESYSNREEVVSEDDTAHAKKVTLQSRKASQQMQSLRAQSSTHLQKNNYDSNEEYFTEDELRQELAECRRQLRSQSYDPAMSRTVNPVGSTRRPESDSEDERARGSCYNGRCSRRPTGFNYSFVPPTQGNYDNQTNYQRKSRKENLFAYNEPPKQKLKGFPPETTFRCYVERNPIQGGPVYLHGAPIFECQPDDARCQASLGNSEAIYHCTLDHSVPAVQPGPLYDNHQYQTLGQQSQMMYMPDPQADYGRRMHGEAGGGNYAGNSTTGCNFTSNGSPVGGGSPGSNVEKVVPSCAPTGCNFLRTSSPGGSGNITSSGSPVGSANFLPFGSAKSTSNFQPTGSPVNNGSSGGGNFLPFVPAVSTSNFGSPGSPVENFVPAGTNAVGYNFGPNRECVSCSNFGPNREGAVNGNYEPNRECYSCVNFPQNREFPAGGGFAQNQVYPASFNGGQNREYPASGSCGSNRDCGVGENFETNRESGVGGGYGQNMESYCCGNYAAMGSSPAPRHYQCGQYDTQSCCCGGMQRSPLLSARPSQQVTTQCTQNPMARTESWSQRSQDYGNNSQNYLQKYSYGASRTASNNPPPVYTPPAILSIPPNASTGKYEPVDDNQQ